MNKNFDRQFNSTCITQVTNTILSLLGLEQDPSLAPAIPEVIANGPCDRVFMHNPDAIGTWVFNHYSKFTDKAVEQADLKLPMLSVIPPVTPVCFASMYSGLQPDGHGIHKYEKPVLKCQTVFDKLIEAGKKVAIVSTEGDSISLIFLERQMDYFIYKSVKECNQKAKELIEEDKYDVIILYNTDYDYWMHRVGPKGLLARKALKQNVETYCELKELITNKWKNHRTALAFAPDHGCHYKGPLGTHGINETCDMNIFHLWSFV